MHLEKPQIILLTDTVLFGEVGNTRYMGAYALAGQLQQSGFRVMVVDYFTQHEDFFSFIEPFLSDELLFVGISSTFLAPFSSIKTRRENRSKGLDLYYKGELWFDRGEDLDAWLGEFRKLLLKHSSSAKLILGGAKAQFAIWRNQYYRAIDFVCLGAAEKTLVEVARCIEQSREIPHKKMHGIRILDNAIDLNDKVCPSTVWTKNFAVQPKESLPMEIARGCVFNCKFCHYDKKESFKKDISLLKSEFIQNYENFGTTCYHFCDDCFNDHPKKVEALCNMFLSLPFKLEWVAYARVDVAVKFPETMDIMIASGAKGLYFGLESFDHRVALKAGKGTPTDKVKEFLLNFNKKHSQHCLLEGSFIVGLPGETVDSQDETAKWIFEHEKIFDFLTVGPLGIMPYIAQFDKLLFDYAEYSRNPEKYGFKKIDYSNRYWEHDTFTSITAAAKATEIKEKWDVNHGFQKIKTIWLYPHLRTLGYSGEEIFQIVREPNFADKVATDEIAQRFKNFKTRYWRDIGSQSRAFDRKTETYGAL